MQELRKVIKKELDWMVTKFIWSEMVNFNIHKKSKIQ